MRTTVELDPDTAAALEELRRTEGWGTSRALNELIRRGLLPRPAPDEFHQRTCKLGLRIDVSNVAAALDELDGPAAR